MRIEADKFHVVMTSIWSEKYKQYVLYVEIGDDRAKYSMHLSPKGLKTLQKEIELIMERNKETEK